MILDNKKSVFNTQSQEEEKKEMFEQIDPEDVAYAKTIINLKRTEKRLYETEIAGEKIIWRPIKRSEYKAAFSLQFPEDYDEYDRLYDRETYIAKCIVLYPENAVDDLAGVAEIITDLCLEKSGFTSKNAGVKEL